MARQDASDKSDSQRQQSLGSAKVVKPVLTDRMTESRNTISDETASMKQRDKELNQRLEQEKKAYQASKQPIHSKLDNEAKDFEVSRTNLMTEAKRAGERTDDTYGSLSTKMQKFANEAEKESQNAMTLAQLADPASSAAFQNSRKVYEDQAQGEGNQGVANFGILSALGGQSANASMQGMGPMTAGQQAAMFAGSQRQAGEAFANTQRRMQALRDQGLERGFSAHQNQYNAGQDAKRLFQGAVDQQGNIEKDWSALGAANRGERAGFQSDITGSRFATGNRQLGSLQEDYGLNTGFARDTATRAGGLSQMQMNQANADIGNVMTGNQIAANSAAASEAADAQQKAAMMGTIGTVGGAVAGGVFGGPAGAMAGGAAGGALGNAAGGAMAGSGGGGGSYTATQPAANANYRLSASNQSAAGYNPNNYQGNYSLQGRMQG